MRQGAQRVQRIRLWVRRESVRFDTGVKKGGVLAVSENSTNGTVWNSRNEVQMRWERLETLGVHTHVRASRRRDILALTPALP